MIKRIAAVVIAALLSAACLTGCGTGKQPAAEKLRVCEVTHSVFYAPQYVAMALGFFEQQGLEIELTCGEGADKVMAAVLSGGADIGFAGPEAAVYVYRQGKQDYAQVFAQVTKRDGSFLIARQPAEDFSWQQLRGQTVLPGRKGGVPYMTLEYVLRQNGLDPAQDVVLDNSIQFSLMTAAFVNGTGAYVTAFEPTASTLVRNGQGYIVASVGAAAGEIPYTAYFAPKSFLEQHADAVLRFTKAIRQGEQWVQQHSAAEIAQAIAPSFADTDLSLLTAALQSYKDIDAWCSEPVMQQQAFDRLQTVMQQAGELEQPVPFDQVVNNTFALQAAG
ncbi:MAG: ABC transporter substrate-binding protein [Clostridia bacterium]|nr:ABC transporter substrate-binding protein [Clostridia bacterium]